LSNFQNGAVDVSHIYVDLSSAQPSEGEREIYEKVTLLLTESEEIISILESMPTGAEEIRRALSNPTLENEMQAFNTTKECANFLYRTYNFANELSSAFSQIVTCLAQADDEKSAMEDNQASARMFCDILSFVLKFDEVKMRTPQLQNMFAYYRRNLMKHANDPELIVKDQDANFLSLYSAPACPMMTKLAQDLKQVLIGDMEKKICHMLATIANVCLQLLKAENSEDINELCVRAMVATIVLYDQAVPSGVFMNTSGVNVKGAVSLVCKNFNEPRTLVNALRFSTIHLLDENTPSSILAHLQQFD
jgi:hypothetical protein